MQKNNADPRTGITQDELLALLEQSGRSRFTKRRLTQLISDGLLPHPRRATREGSNQPLYLWEQVVFERAAYLYDLKTLGITPQKQFLALWLHGYEVPFEPMLHRWVQLVETFVYNVTGGQQDPDEALDQISTSIVEYLEPKWKFSPQPDEVIHKVGFDSWGVFTEFWLSTLAIPAFAPDKTMYEGVLKTLQIVSRIAQSGSDPEDIFSWFLEHQDDFTLPQLRETLLNATSEEWAQAREDYLTLCQATSALAELLPRQNARITREMRESMFLTCDSKLLPLLLSARSYGYGDWIDEWLAILSDLSSGILADSEACDGSDQATGLLS